jgi:hypothetical protein
LHGTGAHSPSDGQKVPTSQSDWLADPSPHLPANRAREPVKCLSNNGRILVE